MCQITLLTLITEFMCEPKMEVATGDELDKHGELLGVMRIKGEADSSYRKRLLDAALAVGSTDTNKKKTDE